MVDICLTTSPILITVKYKKWQTLIILTTSPKSSWDHNCDLENEKNSP